jgi:hypothetical protein
MRATWERSKLTSFDDLFLKQFAAEYAQHVVRQYKEQNRDLALLPDQLAALVGLLECAAKEARKVGNNQVASDAESGCALLREAAMHLPVRSPFLILVLAGESPQTSPPQTWQPRFAT